MTIDDALDRLRDRARQLVLHAVAAPAAAAARAVLADAKAQWPVRTGVSRAGLDLVEARGSTTFSLEIENRVSYAGQVHGGDSWHDLVAVPMGEVAADSAALGPGQIAAALRGR